MNTFAAIDFETANGQRTSVCSVGVVVVRDGEIAERYYSLIRPVPNYYLVACTRIHGLTRSDTDGERLFPEVWSDVTPMIGDMPLIAHFSRFDEGCLRAVMRYYGMAWPGYQFFCTCTASRVRFGHRLPNHKLNTVAAHVGYDLANHHHALADAEACAHIGIALFCKK